MENKKDLEKDSNIINNDNDVIDEIIDNNENISNIISNNTSIFVDNLPELIDESDTKLTPEDYEDILNNMEDHNEENDKL